MAKILRELSIYGENECGDFTGRFVVGDYVSIKTYNNKFKCYIVKISEDVVDVETDNYEVLSLKVSEIVEIFELFC